MTSVFVFLVILKNSATLDLSVMSTKETEWSEDKLRMFTEGGELNWIEREVAWLSELARIDIPEDDVVVIDGESVADSGLIDWNYVRRRCSDELHDVIKSKEATGLQWSKNKKQCLVRQSKYTFFDQYRQLLRKALDGGYRPPDWESRKDACSASVGTESPPETPQKKRARTTTSANPNARNSRKTAKSKAKAITQIQMACARSIFNVGDEVTAAWFDDDEKGSSWYNGKILSYETIQTDKAFGERRAYTIEFDDGDVTKEPLEDTWIFSKEDYNLDREVYDKKRQLKGINNALLKDSADPYAGSRGYYTTKCTGNKTFTSLGEAMRAYDKETIRQKGDSIKRRELNLPDEWM